MITICNLKLYKKYTFNKKYKYPYILRNILALLCHNAVIEAKSFKIFNFETRADQRDENYTRRAESVGAYRGVVDNGIWLRISRLIKTDLHHLYKLTTDRTVSLKLQRE